MVDMCNLNANLVGYFELYFIMINKGNLDTDLGVCFKLFFI
jgi:hypothetical protein